MRKKRLPIVLFALTLLVSLLCLFACNQTNAQSTTTDEEEAYPLSIHVDESTVPTDAVAGCLSLEKISLTVLYSNDETQTVPLKEDYIAVGCRNYLNEIGTFTLDVYYMDCKTSFQITLSDPALTHFTLRIRDGLPVSVNGSAYNGTKKADEDGVFEDTFSAGDLVTIAWTEQENMSFLYWNRWQGVTNWLPVYWTREDGEKVDNQTTTTVKMTDDFAYMAVDTEIVYTVNFRTFREDLKIGEKTVKKLYASQSEMYDSTDPYSDYLPSITMENYVFSGWTTTYIESLDRSAGASSGEYPLIEPSANEKIAEVEDLLSFTVGGVTYYFDSNGYVYRDSKKTSKISDASVNGANKIDIGSTRYTYQDGKIYDSLYKEVGTICDLYSFTFLQTVYYFDILGNFYLDDQKEETVKNATFVYQDGYVYDTSYRYIPVTENMILYAVWLPIRLSYSPYTSYSQYSAAIDGYQVTEYMGNLTDLEIPDTYNGKKVLSIASSVFENNPNSAYLETVTVPATVLNIGEGTFQYCSSLKAIYVKQGSQVFSSENGVLYREERSILVAYPANKVMRSYEVESNVSTICDYAFYNAVVGKIVVSTVVSSIGSYAFYSDHIDTVDFSKVSVSRLNSAKSHIGTSIFNPHIAQVTLSDNSAVNSYKVLPCFSDFADRLSTDTSAQYLYTYAYSPDVTVLFRKIGSVSAQYFQNKGTTVEIIGITRTVREIDIPDMLSTGVISYRVSSIAYHAFGGCIQLTDVTLPAYLERICDKAFDDTPWAQNTANGLLIANKTLYKYIGSESTVRLPAGVERIAESAFWNNTTLEFINITDNVELNFISAYAFYGCTAFASMSDSQNKTLTLLPALQTIQAYAFTGTAIQTIESKTQSALREIGKSAFENCHYLKSVRFTSSDLENIATDSFFACESLTEVEMTANNSYFATQDGILYQTGFATASLFLYPAGKLSATYNTGDYQKRYVEYKDNAFTLSGKTFVKEEDVTGGVRCTEENGSRTIDLLFDSERNAYYYSIRVTAIGENALYRSNIGGLILGSDVINSEPIMIPGLSYIEFATDTLPLFTFSGLFRYTVYYPDYVYFPEISKKDASSFFGDSNVELMNEKYCSLLPLELAVVNDDFVYAWSGETVKLVRATRTKDELSVPSSVTLGGQKRYRASVGKYAFDGWYLTKVTFSAEKNQVGDEIGTTAGLIVFPEKTYYFDKNGEVYETYTAKTLSGEVSGASVNESAGFVRVESKTYRTVNDILYEETGKRYEEITCSEHTYYRYQNLYYSATDFDVSHEVSVTDEELAQATSIVVLSVGSTPYYVNGEKVYSDKAMTSYVGDYDEEAGTALIDIGEYIIYNNDIYKKTEAYIVYQDDMPYQTTFYYNAQGEVFTGVERYAGQKTNGTISASSLTLYQNNYTLDSGEVRLSALSVGSVSGVITLNGVTFYYDYEDKIYLDEQRLFPVGTKTLAALTLSSSAYTFERHNAKLWVKNGETYADFCYYYQDGKVYGDNGCLSEVPGVTLSGSDISFSASFLLSGNTVIYPTSGGDFVGIVTVNSHTYYYDIDGKVYEEETFETEIPSSQINREENKILINDITYYMDNNIVYKEKDMLTELGRIYGRVVLDQTYYFGINGTVYTDSGLTINQTGYLVDFSNRRVIAGDTYLFYEKQLYRIAGDFYGKISLSYSVLYHDGSNVYYDVEKCYQVVGAKRNAVSDSIILNGTGYYMDNSRTVYIESGIGTFAENVFQNASNIERIIFEEQDTLLIPAVTSSTFGSRFNQGLQINIEKGTCTAFIAKWKSANLQIFTYGTNSEASPYLIEDNSPFAVLTYKNEDGETVMPIEPLHSTVQADDLAEFRLYAKKEGYEVGGWTDTVTGTAVNVTGGYVISYNQKLLCTWQARTYTVYIYIDERYTPDFEAEKISKNKYKVTVDYKAEYNWSLTGFDGKTYLLSSWKYGEKVIQPKGYWSLVLDSETDEGKEVVFYAQFTKRVYTLQYQADVTMESSSQTVEYNTAYTLEVPSKDGYTFAGWCFSVGDETVKLTGSDGVSLLNWTITEGGENDVYSVVPDWKADTFSVKFFLDEAEGVIYETIGTVEEEDNLICLQENTKYYFNESGAVFTDSARTSKVDGAYFRPSENRLYLAVDKDYYLENNTVYLAKGTAVLYNGTFTLSSTTYYMSENGTVYSDSAKQSPVENAFFDFEDMTVELAGKRYYCKTSPYATGEVLFGSSDYSFVRVTGVENADYFAGWKDANNVIYTDSDGKATHAWDKSTCALLYAVWPVTVATSGELIAVLTADMSESVVLTADISLTNISFGSASNPYTGVFNGNNHTVEYVYNDDEGSEWNGYVGLFAQNNGTVKNLNIKVTRLVKDIDTSFYGEDKPVYIGTVCGVNNGIVSAVKIDILQMEVTVDGLMMCYEDGGDDYLAGVVCAENNGSVSGQCVYHYSGDTVYYSKQTETLEQWAEKSDFEEVWKENYADYYTLNGTFENVTIPFEQLTVVLSGTEAGSVNLSTQRITVGTNKYFYENGVVYSVTGVGSVDESAQTITVGDIDYTYSNGKVWQNTELVGAFYSAQGTFTVGSNAYMFTADNTVYKKVGTISVRQLTCLIESVSYTLETAYYTLIENAVPYKQADVSEYASSWERYYTKYYVIEEDEFVPASNEYDSDTVYYEPKEESELYEKATDDIDNYLDGYWKDRYERYYTFDGYTYVQVTVPYSSLADYYTQVKDIFTDKTRFQVGTGTNTMSFTLKEYAER